MVIVPRLGSEPQTADPLRRLLETGSKLYVNRETDITTQPEGQGHELLHYEIRVVASTPQDSTASF